VLEYIKGSVDLEYTLGADNLFSFRSWVDASYAIHDDMKSHTGGVISFGMGGLICKSSKQKLNTKCSKEAEVVGASDYLPNTLWVQMFMAAQGYPINKTHFEQDNESAIQMEKNGRASAVPRSRHIRLKARSKNGPTRTGHIQVDRHLPSDVWLVFSSVAKTFISTNYIKYQVKIDLEDNGLVVPEQMNLILKMPVSVCGNQGAVYIDELPLAEAVLNVGGAGGEVPEQQQGSDVNMQLYENDQTSGNQIQNHMLQLQSGIFSLRR
jgi:hypothetical protein